MRIPCRVLTTSVVFFIEHIDLSLENCRFGAKKDVSHYVVRRKNVILTTNYNFELEMCGKAKKRAHGAAARSPPVAEMIASEARRARASVRVSARLMLVRRPLSMPVPGRAIERVLRDLATPSNYIFASTYHSTVQTNTKNSKNYNSNSDSLMCYLSFLFIYALMRSFSMHTWYTGAPPPPKKIEKPKQFKQISPRAFFFSCSMFWLFSN